MLLRAHARTVVLLLLGMLLSPLAGRADSPGAAPTKIVDTGSESRAIVIGFQGAIFHHQVPHFRDAVTKMHDEYGAHTLMIFNGAPDRKKAMRAVETWLDTNGDGTLSSAEKEQARIILVGHSWGGPALLAFARQLKKKDIPVALTIQIDSVGKLWHPGRVVPANVDDAANFYQAKGDLLLPTRANIYAADPAHTKILGDFLVPYDRNVAATCKDYTVFLRLLSKYHIAIVCDPRLWTQVDALVGAELAPPKTETAKSN